MKSVNHQFTACWHYGVELALNAMTQQYQSLNITYQWASMSVAFIIIFPSHCQGSDEMKLSAHVVRAHKVKEIKGVIRNCGHIGGCEKGANLGCQCYWQSGERSGRSSLLTETQSETLIDSNMGSMKLYSVIHDSLFLLIWECFSRLHCFQYMNVNVRFFFPAIRFQMPHHLICSGPPAKHGDVI